MKKLIVCLALSCLAYTANAQKKKTTTSSTTTTTSYAKAYGSEGFSKGDIAITGAFQFESRGQAAEGGEGTGFTFLPSAQYLLTNNWALVGTIGVENTTPKGGDSSNTFVLGAAARYYFKPSSKFTLFGEGGLEVRLPEDFTIFNIGVQPGMSYFVSDHFFLETTFGFTGITFSSPEEGDSSTDFNFGVNLRDVKIGVGYKF
jgi:opacity protein-like surface antigen